jgi:hypothetical protein
MPVRTANTGTSRARDAGHHERPELEARPAPAEFHLGAARLRPPRLDLESHDLVATQRLQDRQAAEQRLVGVDDLEAVTRAHLVHELAHARVGLVGGHHAHRPAERLQPPRRHLPRAEVARHHDQSSMLGQRLVEYLAVDDPQVERPRPRTPLLEPFGQRSRELGEHLVGVQPVPEAATAATHLPLVGEHRRTLPSRDREDDRRDHRRCAALPPLRPVDAP